MLPLIKFVAVIGIVVASMLAAGTRQAQAQIVTAITPAVPTVTYVPQRRGLFGLRTVYRPVVTYSAPVTTFYAPAPVTTYYAPAPVTTYYAPSPVTTYYAPSPVTTYYAPAPTVVQSPVVVERPVVVQSPVTTVAPTSTITTYYPPLIGY